MDWLLVHAVSDDDRVALNSMKFASSESAGASARVIPLSQSNGHGSPCEHCPAVAALVSQRHTWATVWSDEIRCSTNTAPGHAWT
jgi:hypothetical protein